MTQNEKTAGVIALLLLLFWKPSGASSVSLTQTCTYPDGTSVQVPLGQACPYNVGHGGQSQVNPAGGGQPGVPCYPVGFTGPLPPGAAYCNCYPPDFTGPLPPGGSYCTTF